MSENSFIYPEFDTYFTLEEAVALIPYVKEETRKTHTKLLEIHDEIVLYKRLHKARFEEGLVDDTDSRAVGQVLRDKLGRYEEVMIEYIETLEAKGIQVQDVEKGLVDFPYKDSKGSVYFLCWYIEEEALLYFHEIHAGFAGRTPITLLPE